MSQVAEARQRETWRGAGLGQCLHFISFSSKWTDVWDEMIVEIVGIAVKAMRWVAGFQVFLLCCPCFKLKQVWRGGGLCALALSLLLVDDFS